MACNQGHLFCRTCLWQWINMYGHRNCPVGGQPLQASDVRGIITFDKVVDSLEVYCSRRTEGCNWTGALKIISSHQQHCLHKPVQCTRYGCSQTFPCGQMQRHPSECDMRPQVCGYCSYAVLPAVSWPPGVGMPEGPCNVPVQFQPGKYSSHAISSTIKRKTPHRYC